MPALRRAFVINSSTIGPSIAASSTGACVGPRCQPSAIANTRPLASNTRPVIAFYSSDASQVTIGAIQRGEPNSRSSSVGGVGERFSVMRVSATGATAFTVTP